MRLAAITIVAPVGRLRKRTRLSKFANLYQNANWSVSFVGWEREDAESASPLEPDIVTKITLVGGGYSTKGLRRKYVIWIVKTATHLLRAKPPFVHALGLEGAVAALPLRFLRKDTVLIFDDADRFSMSQRLPGPVQGWFERLERFVSRLSTIHIVPGIGRYPDGIPSTQALVVRNTPSESALREAASMTQGLKKGFRVLVTGYLGETRGISVIDRVAELLSDDDQFVFVAAGRTAGESVKRLLGRSNVNYHGEVSNSEALALCADSSIVFTLYDPAVQINQFAEPNKWGDCVAVGVPFIVNEEVRTAKAYVDAGAAVSFPYDNPERAAEILRELARDPLAYKALRSAIGQLAESTPSFDAQVKTKLLTAMEALR